MSDPKTQPIELNLEQAEHLEVRWADGHRSIIPLLELRRACPCAACRAIREGRECNPLAVNQPVPDPRETATVDEAELVGNYGLRIRWKDGHAAGIYDFALLRSLG